MQEFASDVPTRRALESRKLSRASFYRHSKPAANGKTKPDVASLIFTRGFAARKD
jgi:hypothetical protein